MRIPDGESELSMKLRYLNKSQVNWMHNKFRTGGIIFPAIGAILLNFDNYLGYTFKKKFKLRLE